MPNNDDIDLIVHTAKDVRLCEPNSVDQDGLCLVPIFKDMQNALDADGLPAEEATNHYGAIELQYDGEPLLAVPIAAAPEWGEQAIRDHFMDGLVDLDPEQLAAAVDRLRELEEGPSYRPRPR